MHQSEQQLENNLITQLERLGYARADIKDEAGLVANLKIQLEKHNDVALTDDEFARVLNHLNKGNVFDKAKILRDRMHLVRDDGTDLYLEFINQKKWCRNEYQVASQIAMEGTYRNRYDVTLLVNGLPLAQIELKRRGLELKEAFNQTNRYQRHSFGASHGLFQYIQIFVISNGVNTKYYANNRKQSFKQTFFWADRKNRNVTRLEAFADVFLEPCHLSKMIVKYIVLAEAEKVLMVLRPYQFYAIEAIVGRAKAGGRNGYVWHTTGSGKTLTSFKASQILTELPDVRKVVFVVDRKDLDYQTTKEFNSFSKGSIDGTDHTGKLVKQLGDDGTRLIVTTIQKLNTAISRTRYSQAIGRLRNERVIFIFDECHRSQFGETHKRIKEFFGNHQMFGFTGTPIFAENAVGTRTTAELFDECLHKYVITDAIADENVLKFSVEYVGRYRRKDGGRTEVDIEVEDIDTRELLESPERLEKIAGYIIANHGRKTHGGDFTAMFCVSGVDTLIRYYDIFKARREAGEHDLRIATIFSYTANEDDKDANGLLDDADGPEISEAAPVNRHSREKLDEYIRDYNDLFGTKFSTKDSQSFYNYYNDIAKKVKERRIDILLVVNMFLTGFDVKTLNTLYVDKRLRYHGLVQAFSRTNRTLDERKSQGNIVCFRNLKQATDEAIALFSKKDAKEAIMIGPYEEYVGKFNDALGEMRKLVPTVGSVDALADENEELHFVQYFRQLLRLRNILESFSDFSFMDLAMGEQEFEDYKSKYLDLYDKVRSGESREKASILEDVDFELELIHRDEINVAYILSLLADLVDAEGVERERRAKSVLDAVSGEVKLRSKRQLIEKFIAENIPKIKHADQVAESFDAFMDAEKKKAFDEMCREENLKPKDVEVLIERYLFTGKKPLNHDIASTLQEKPMLLERGSIVSRVASKIMRFVETFVEGL
jgi:type I restriction enzyme R subunit